MQSHAHTNTYLSHCALVPLLGPLESYGEQAQIFYCFLHIWQLSSVTTPEDSLKDPYDKLKSSSCGSAQMISSVKGT